MRANALELLDELVSRGEREISADQARVRLNKSAQSTTNILTRLVRDGWLERVRRGHYLIRPLGQLGVPASSRDELGALVAAVAGDRQTRVAYATALQEHDLLTRPWRPIQVAVDRRLFVRSAGGRPIEPHVQRADQIAVGSESFGPSRISTVERSLLECAERPRHVGGIATVAEAFARAPQLSPRELKRLAETLEYSVGLRRLVALDQGLALHRLDRLKFRPPEVRDIPLDPADPRRSGPLDERAGVRWSAPIAELQAVIGQ